jgi:uncharacterized SAM-binding protein YcdF (DUF218 family)
VPYSDSLPELDTTLIEKINREHLITTPLAPADLLFLFGTRHGVPEFVEETARLWFRGFFKHAIISGGVTPGGDRSEATTIKELLTNEGVPSDFILTEEEANNTGENVIFSLPILDARLGLKNIRSLIAVGKLCSSRRYLMTLQQHWPDVEKMLVPINWFGIPPKDWHLHAHSRDRVLSEVAKIEPYKEKGFIADWPAK